jgi:hypothetical protein
METPRWVKWPACAFVTQCCKQDDCSATFSGTSISGNISTISAVGCDPLGRTDNGETLNTLDGESGPVLKYCQSTQLNSRFTEADMRQGGSTIVKFQSCSLGGHEFLFNVDQSGTYVFLSKMNINGQSYDLNLNIDVDSGTNAKCDMPIFSETMNRNSKPCQVLCVR